MPKLVAMQGTQQWLFERIGRASASRMKDIIAISKTNGKPLKARDDYLKELVAERMTGFASDHYVTPAMQHGLDFEDEAVNTYEEITGELTDRTGFWLHDTIADLGASPDRMVGNDGLIEVKCPSTTKFVQWLQDGVVPEEHHAQMLTQLAVTQRKWCDFVAYDPRINRGPKIFIRRFTPTDEQIKIIEAEATKFLAEVDAVFNAVTAQG